MALITMSCLSAMATAPFAAQHFGTVTPWGLVANIIGIPLSDFLASMAELRMGKGIEQVDLAQCLLACKHDFSHGISASIVMKAKGLTAACKDLETAFVLTSVTPRYPCYSGKLIYYISQKKDIIT
jgi:hypothetical protein